MENNSVSRSESKMKTRKSTPSMLVDGTVCYTLAVRYPNDIMDALRKLCYENKLNNMTEAIFYCIEGHKKEDMANDEVMKFTRKEVTALTIRFRENHYDYIQQVCKNKSLKTFSSGIIHVVYEYLKAEKRL